MAVGLWVVPGRRGAALCAQHSRLLRRRCNSIASSKPPRSRWGGVATSWNPNRADATPLPGSWNPSSDYGRCLPQPYALSRSDDRQTVSTLTHNQLGGVAVQSAITENYRYPRKTPDRYIGDAAGSLSWGRDAPRLVHGVSADLLWRMIS